MLEESEASRAELKRSMENLRCQSWTTHPKSQGANHCRMAFQLNSEFIQRPAIVRPLAELHS